MEKKNLKEFLDKNMETNRLLGLVMERLRDGFEIDSSELSILDKKEIKEVILKHFPENRKVEDFREPWVKDIVLSWFYERFGYVANQINDTQTRNELKDLFQSENIPKPKL